jgi:hypothetical protein
MQWPARRVEALSSESCDHQQSRHVTIAIHIWMDFQKINKQGSEQLRTPYQLFSIVARADAGACVMAAA